MSKFILPTSTFQQHIAPKKDPKAVDTRRFQPTIKNEGKYYNALVRFIPQKDMSAPLYVEKYSHAFQENGQWYIEECPTTLGKDHKCPVCESNRSDFNTHDEALKNRARNRKRKKIYVANVLVVNDKTNPANNGKVMYWQFPKTVLDQLNLKWKPESEFDEPSNPFCPVTGANFNLVMKWDDKIKFPSYVGSQFQSAKSIGTDEQIQEIINQTYDLSDFVSPTNYKEYSELNERFIKVTNPGLVTSTGTMVVAPQLTGSVTLEKAIGRKPVVEENAEDDWLNEE